MALTIREYREEDKTELEKLFYKVRKTAFFWLTEEDLQADTFTHSTEGEKILVAEVDGGIAGFVSVWVQSRFVHNLFVSDALQRNGVGIALLRSAADAFGRPLTLKCVTANQNAVNFYLSNGFRVRERCDTDALPYLLMESEGW